MLVHLHFNTNKFTSIKVIKTPVYRHKVIKNDKLSKAWMKLKLIIGLCHQLALMLLKIFFFMSLLKHCMTVMVSELKVRQHSKINLNIN